MEFKDEVTAGDGAIRASAPGKGKLCAATSVFLFKYLEEKGVKTHLLGYDGDRRLVVRRIKNYSNRGNSEKLCVWIAIKENAHV